MKLTVNLNQEDFVFNRPADLESLWEEMDQESFGLDERIPYWVEIWPAAIFLAQWLYQGQEQISHSQCLDLGCGLGLTALAAARSKALILAMDNEEEALRYARHNASLNRVKGVHWLVSDWRLPAFKKHCFDYIWGAEIIYEKRFFPWLINLFDLCLKPQGRIWLSTPKRHGTALFWNLLLNNGWNCKIIQSREISYREYQNMHVDLWEVRKQH